MGIANHLIYVLLTLAFTVFVGNTFVTPPLSTSTIYYVACNENECLSGLVLVTAVVLSDPMPQITGPVNFCEGESITIGLTQSYSDMDWSNGSSSQSIAVSNGGTFFVTVTVGAPSTRPLTSIKRRQPVPGTRLSMS